MGVAAACYGGDCPRGVECAGGRRVSSLSARDVYNCIHGVCAD